MDKFWEWMKEKTYAVQPIGHDIYYQAECVSNYWIKFTKQMLIGYMIEYLFEKNVHVMNEIETAGTIGTVYNMLEEEIKELT